jgi:hypothetical protein
MQLKSWGVAFSSAMHYSAARECACGAELPSIVGFYAYVPLLVGFTTDGARPGRGDLKPRVGIAIFECDECHSNFWFHLSPETAEFFQEHAPQWLKQ